MRFSTAFWNMLLTKPLTAMGALYWYTTGRKVRARNRLHLRLSREPKAYQLWISTVELAHDVSRVAPSIARSWAYRPTFTIVIDDRGDLGELELETLLKAISEQIYEPCEIIVVTSRAQSRALSNLAQIDMRVMASSAPDNREALIAAIRASRGEYIIPVDTGTVLPPLSIFRYAESLQTLPRPDLLYGDHDHISPLGKRTEPWLKSKWNSELALSQDYFTHALALRRSSLILVCPSALSTPESDFYALGISVAALPGAVVRHVEHVQAHVLKTSIKSFKDRSPVVAALLKDRGYSDAHVKAGPYGTTQVEWPMPRPNPMVSIIIPTRDRIDLLRPCLLTLKSLTEYSPFEVIIIDNNSQYEESIAFFSSLVSQGDASVIRDCRPYNFSQLNNRAAVEARGTYLCFLNNDTEVIAGDWLSAMIRQAVRPHVGAVGARLLYDDGSIQHAGVTVGLGGAAGHAHRFLPYRDAGYFARSHAAHYVTAVTAACMVVEKAKFEAVGGFDEEHLAVAFNDVDLCLKLQSRGWSNVYTPGATLIHHESKSRGKDFSPEHIERYRRELMVLQERWKTVGYLDPLHHPQLDRQSEEYAVRL